ncbi:uncharacterized protein MELLADRAFT_106884 [Melampsora larici-populina 98AG31]|uniref:Uncharacterized protein n=1 Tax=Melampsora larici-populina (strain 98AG31 / pathotype 3-4-7) TaxID=747676 RepID=F4RMY8_MELLP|nr:uncharacterized protein MELLADRAFT_106884 [Melampsora larici-populina 98AG31]EGG06304.1 hypothetical protein MELLADRAFT_106884 [Melampsora larici-populina 98AG31]
MASFNDEMEAVKNKVSAAGTKIRITKKTRSQNKTVEADNAEDQKSQQQERKDQTKQGGSRATTDGALDQCEPSSSTKKAKGNKGEADEAEGKEKEGEVEGIERKAETGNQEGEGEVEIEDRKAAWMQRTKHEYYWGDSDRADKILRAFNAVYGGAPPTQEERDTITNNVGKNVPRSRNQQTKTAQAKRPRTASLVSGSGSDSEDQGVRMPTARKRAKGDEEERGKREETSKATSGKKEKSRRAESSEEEDDSGIQNGQGASVGRQGGYLGNNWIPNYKEKKAAGFWNAGQRSDPIQVFGQGGGRGRSSGTGGWGNRGKGQGNGPKTGEEQNKE